MSSPLLIRNLYQPVQPSVQQSAEDVLYLEILPDINIQPFIYCYWQLRTKSPLPGPYKYRVVADGCIDIYFELDNPAKNFVMGFSKQYTEFPLNNTFNYIGIRFLPTMFAQLFRINAVELSNRFEDLRSVVPRLSGFITDNFNEKQRPEKIKALLDTYFLQQIKKASFNDDPRLYDALATILQNCGTLDIEKDLNTGISPRQLRRLFEYYVGDTAKTFSKVIRFQHILHTKPSRQRLRQNKLFFDAGYYDQAHFIKEFKNFYGLTPTKAFDG